MKRAWILAVFFALISVSGAFADPDADTTPYIAGEILVKTGTGPILGWELQQVPPGQEKAEVARQRAEGRQAEVNGLWSVVETIPNDPRYPEQYGPVRIKGPQAWDFSKGDPSVVISVIDTGVFCGHEDLSGKCVPGFDFVNNDADPNDDHGHGTHVAGIAAAVTDNGIGVAGMCWFCAVQPVKVLNSGGSGTWEAVALGIVFAADNGGDVINMSLGGSGFSQVVQDAVVYAEGRGVMIFAAAGNTGGTPILYPARYPEVIAVAATDSLDNRASFSSYGPEVELAAPGVANLSSVPTYICSLCDPSGYRSLSGTSMATPHAAGVGALLLSFRPELTNIQAREVLQLTAVDKGNAGRDEFYGFGLVDAYAALTFGGEFPTPTLEPTQAPIPTDTPTPEPGTALCGKITGGLVLVPSGSPYYLTCDIDVKGGLTAISVTIEMQGFGLFANQIYFRGVTMQP